MPVIPGNEFMLPDWSVLCSHYTHLMGLNLWPHTIHTPSPTRPCPTPWVTCTISYFINAPSHHFIVPFSTVVFKLFSCVDLSIHLLALPFSIDPYQYESSSNHFVFWFYNDVDYMICVHQILSLCVDISLIQPTSNHGVDSIIFSHFTISLSDYITTTPQDKTIHFISSGNTNSRPAR